MGVALRGTCMGIAEIVPGVSGGTIAFVTGIYRELIDSLAAFSPTSLFWVVTRPRHFWRHHNLGFLLWLGGGMLLGIVLFARLINGAIAVAPNLVWGFFFGLVLFSVFDIGRVRSRPMLFVLGVPGLLLGIAASAIEPIGAEPSHPAYFLGGALAICAWLLPAVSGSFVLVVLGLYTNVLQAAASFEWVVLAALALGAATGLMLFARVLRYLMERFLEPVLSFLTGFMAGALFKLWPWQAEGAPLSPTAWSELVGIPARVGFTLTMMVAGAVALIALARARPAQPTACQWR